MEIDAKAEELIKAIEEAEESDDSDKFHEKMEELEGLYMNHAFNGLRSLDYSSASEYFAKASEVAKGLYEHYKMFSNSLDKGEYDDKTANDAIVEMLKPFEEAIYFTQGYAHFSLGQANKISRNPGDAIENFKEAKRIFGLLHEKTNEGLFKFLSDYTHANEIVSEALEYFIRGNYNNAKSVFQRAKIYMENILEEIPDYIKKEKKSKKEYEKEYESLKSPITIDYRGCEVLYYLSDSKDQFAKGNFALALEKSEKLCDIFHHTIEPTLDTLPKPLRNLHLGDYYNFSGHKYLAEGELFREQDKWDDSLECYKKAKGEWETGADFYLRSGLPQAIALQEFLINYSSSTIEVYIRQCKKERELKSKIKDLENEMNTLQQSLTEAIKPAGVTVNTTQEMVSTVEQNVQIIQTIENGVRQNIEKLLEQLDNLPIDTSKKDEITNKANDVLNSKEHGHQFLERAKKFTKDVSEITKNLGEIAKPILPFVSALSLLL